MGRKKPNVCIRKREAVSENASNSGTRCILKVHQQAHVDGWLALHHTTHHTQPNQITITQKAEDSYYRTPS
jgi:hypothetical protein